MSDLKLTPLDARRLADFETLLSGREFGGCYCAVWTAYDEGWTQRCRERPHENLEHTRRRVRAGEHAGFLAYREVDGALVAWTGAGPKTGFPLLKEKPGSRLGPWEDSVWAIACLAVAFPYRGEGAAVRVVELLLEKAQAAGARSVEAYPAEPEGDEDAYRGARSLYERLGFAVAESESLGERTILRMEKAL